jgi:CRP-like cAMP-binding protein
MSDAEVATFLSTVPLFAGVPEADLAELGQLLRRRELPAGEVLWREGEESAGMLLVVEGRVSLSLSLPGGREVAFGSLGPAEILGEVPLVDGGRHSATARAEEPVTVLLLRRADFEALVSRRHPTAFAIKRGIAGHACGRLRFQLESLAASLGGEPSDDGKPPAELEFCPPPDSGYVRRLATFRAFDSLALWAFLTAGRYARCPAGRTLVAEGEVSTACYLMMNGAVEKVIVRGGRRVRVGLAGPGQAFGYESLIDGRPAPTTAISRERCRLLVLPHEAFQRLFHEETIGSHVFLDVINRDVIASLRQAQRPQARLAASLQGTSTPAGAGDPPARR